MKKILIMLLFVVFIVGCNGPEAYTAYKDGQAVLEFENKPGYLVSTGYFPDEGPISHPFLDARALTPDYEDELGKIVRASNSFDDFIIRLVENGYEVVEGEAVEDDGAFPFEVSCAELCADEGAEFAACRQGSVDDLEASICLENEIDAGIGNDCIQEEGEEGAFSVCCCKKAPSPEKMSIIRVYSNTADEELKEIPLGEIFVNTEKGEVIVSTIAEDKLLAALMKGIDAAKSKNLTLEYENPEMIDGEEALSLYADIIEPTNEQYTLVLRGFLSFEYDWDVDLFDFDLVEVNKWSAYTKSDTCVDAIVDGEKVGGCETELAEVLTFQNSPGILTGKALPPPGYEPEEHTFLSGSILDSTQESNIRNILDESISFVDFLTKLVENDYLVKAEEGRSMLR